MGRGVVVKRSKLLAQLRELGATQKHVVVGVLGREAQQEHLQEYVEGDETVGKVGVSREGAPTVAQVAQWNHYGTSTTPARPFLTIALERHGEELRKLQARLGLGIIMGKLGLEQALGLLGEAAVGAVKRTISEGVPPPNAPSTIARKGSSTPLINFGQLRGSITYAVRDSQAGD